MSNFNGIFIDKINNISLDDILTNHLRFAWTDATIAKSRYSDNRLSP
jgi:hypothetical protein